jgi:hypothetical protein
MERCDEDEELTLILLPCLLTLSFKLDKSNSTTPPISHDDNPRLPVSPLLYPPPDDSSTLPTPTSVGEHPNSRSCTTSHLRNGSNFPYSSSTDKPAQSAVAFQSVFSPPRPAGSWLTLTIVFCRPPTSTIYPSARTNTAPCRTSLQLSQILHRESRVSAKRIGHHVRSRNSERRQGVA